MRILYMKICFDDILFALHNIYQCFNLYTQEYQKTLTVYSYLLLIYNNNNIMLFLAGKCLGKTFLAKEMCYLIYTYYHKEIAVIIKHILTITSKHFFHKILSALSK